MLDRIKGDLEVQEVYVDDLDVPTVILHGETEMGPTTVHLKATALEMVGLIIGEPYQVEIKVVNPGDKHDQARAVYESMWDRDADGGAART